jgi:hypothetical protein
VDLEVIQEYQLRDEDMFPIEELATTRDGTHSKEDRISRLEPDFNRGIFYLPAPIYHPHYGGGMANQALWDVWTEEDSKRMEEAGGLHNQEVGTIVYRPMGNPNNPLDGLSRAQRACQATFQSYRIVTALKRRNEDGDMYDLTRVFLEEYKLHPFAPHDDAIDAASRIYDMQPTKPVPFEAASAEPTVHKDS